MLYVIKNSLGEYLQCEEGRDGPAMFTNEITKARIYQTTRNTYSIEEYVIDNTGGDSRRIHNAREAFKGLATQAVERKVTEI